MFTPCYSDSPKTCTRMIGDVKLYFQISPMHCEGSRKPATYFVKKHCRETLGESKVIRRASKTRVRLETGFKKNVYVCALTLHEHFMSSPVILKKIQSKQIHLSLYKIYLLTLINPYNMIIPNNCLIIQSESNVLKHAACEPPEPMHLSGV